MELTEMFDRLLVCIGYCPNCFANGQRSKVYRPKADRGEWVGDKYFTHKGEHFSGTCSECGWNTKEGDPISIEEMAQMKQQAPTPQASDDENLPF
ncbi:hypothetical protein [Ligilactobacillus acidipiscis]|uniref:Uncharacterized protein n=1 Tax=Ligilactobacillus acidipiscis TaxID=89059 RepID=A0A1K1KSV4_9LACO|nr:hypothetical protein [Ligilactobacillus acidipiscis]SFV40541.1 hypothetical protein LAC1533_1121 [Ligilactobacillus acidipiscis]